MVLYKLFLRFDIYHILLSISDIVDTTQYELDHSGPKSIFKNMSKGEIDLLTKCIDYYQDLYPLQKISRDLRAYPHKLTKVIQFLYKYQNVYVKKQLNDNVSIKQHTLEEALHKVQLPPVQLPQVQLPQVQLPQVQLPQVQLHQYPHKNKKTITLSKTKINKSSLQLHELELVKLCEDYYKGFYPEALLKQDLQTYLQTYNLQHVLQYLYN